MTRQARPSAVIMGFDIHMILEAVPAHPSNTQTGNKPSSGHQATMPEPCLPGRTATRHDQAHTLFAQTMGYVTATAACSRLAPTWAVT